MKTTPLLALALALLWSGAGYGADSDDLKRSDQAEKTAAKLRTAIKDETKALRNHPWAGDYYCGDGLGMNVSLLLAPKSGYLFEWHGCLGMYDRNYGAVTASQGRLRLSFTFANKREGFQGIAEELIPIAWGDRRYLIPAEEIVGFCSAVNAGDEPRTDIHGKYLLRRGDEQKTAAGFSNAPPEFKACLLSHPIEVKITGIGKSTTRLGVYAWRFKETRVTLNAGRKAGLLPGMALYVLQTDDVVESVMVRKVDEETSEAVVTQIDKEEGGPRIGWKLSTRRRGHGD